MEDSSVQLSWKAGQDTHPRKQFGNSFDFKPPVVNDFSYPTKGFERFI
jgi:hypothetical protein